MEPYGLQSTAKASLERCMCPPAQASGPNIAAQTCARGVIQPPLTAVGQPQTTDQRSTRWTSSPAV